MTTELRQRGASPGTSGFTLIEILVVLAILSILSAIATPQILAARQKAATARVETDLNEIASSFERLAYDTGEYPVHSPTDGPCQVLGCVCERDLSSPDMGVLFNDPVDPYRNWNGPYLANFVTDPVTGERNLFDPWGRPYIYDVNYWKDGHYWRAIHSGGPNKSGENVYDEDNIVRTICRWEF